MRLYPPAWLIGRATTEDIVVGDIEVPAGTAILLSPWLVHRDPRWFADPLAFRPERWLEPTHHPRCAFFPFGGGQRVCVGNHFARMEVALVIAVLVRRLRFDVPADLDLQLEPSVTLRPTGPVPMRVTTRRPSPAPPEAP